MASAFAHAAAGAAFWPLFRTTTTPRHVWAAGAVLAIIPDIDVIGFHYGVAYGDLLGHRGLTHSLLVAIVLGGLLGWIMTREHGTPDRLRTMSYLALAMASHGILDAMTTGGLGVALFAPIDDGRYFFPWRPIAVSPIGVRPFFSERGLAVLLNEALWVGLPSLAIALLGLRLRPRQAVT